MIQIVNLIINLQLVKMIDKETEMLWEQTTTISPTIEPDSKPKDFICIKLIQKTIRSESEEEYEKDLEQAMNLGLKSLPEVPGVVKRGEMNYLRGSFEVMSWTSTYDDEFNQEIILADLFFPRLGKIEFINALYSVEEWKEFLKEIGYNA